MTIQTIVILIIIGAVAFLAWSLYYGIRCAIDEDFAEECRKFQEEYQRKQKAKQEKKRAKWLRNEYEIFRDGQQMGIIPSDMTFQDWLR